MKKMGAYTNILKLRVNMALKRKRLHNYPVQAYIEPTLVCNLRCPACPTGLQLGLRPSASIKWDLFKSALDQTGDYLFSLFMYNWGEPLLHKQTPEMIRYAKDKDIFIILSTNLSLKLTDDYIERLVRSGLDRLIVSLDGTTEEVYSKYRIRGELQLVRENMQRIQAVKKKLGLRTPEVVWQFLVFKHNEDQIAQARAEFNEWGADTLITEGAIMPFEPHNMGFEPSTIPEFNMYHADHHFQKETEKHDRSGRPCTWLYGIFVLNPTGSVSPCCASASDATDFGQFEPEGGFLDIWNNPTFRRARSLFRTDPAAATNGHASTKNSLVQIERRNQSTNESTNESANLVAGMGSNIASALKADELICQKCPIPWRQDDVQGVIDSEVTRLVQSFKTDRTFAGRLRASSAYLLMGAPNWRRWSATWLRNRVALFN